MSQLKFPSIGEGSMPLTLDMLKTVADSLNVGLVVLDKDDQIVFFNKKAGDMLQQDPASRLGSSVLRCHPKRAESRVLKMITEMKASTPSNPYKYEGLVDFMGRFLYEFLYPLWDENDNYLATVAELHDATPRVQYLKEIDEWKPPQIHGRGDSAPRIPFPRFPSD
jgi:PAS domain-containing protein